TQVGVGALAVEAEDQLAGTAVAALEVDRRDRDHARYLLGRVGGGDLGDVRDEAGGGGGTRGGRGRRAGGEAERQGPERLASPRRLRLTHSGLGHLGFP